MNMEGRITIELGKHPDGTTKTSILSNRPVHASRVFRGKRVEHTLQMMPLLFSICGTAQACAATRACEQASGITPSPLLDTIRERLVGMETIREHLWRALLGWGDADHDSMAKIISLQQQYQQALNGEQSSFRINAVIPSLNHDQINRIKSEIENIITLKVLGRPPAEWEQIEKIDQFNSWLNEERTVTTQSLKKIQQVGWGGAGSCYIDLLPELDLVELERQLEQPEYIEHPLWDGEPCESSSLTRTSSPLLDQLHEKYGNGLLVRQVARLTELVQLTSKMDHLENEHQIINYPVPASSHSGFGISEAARGQLIHQVKIDNDNGEQIISRYQILAPTEWNFHPDGVVTRALNSLDIDSSSARTVAEMIITAIDPCVGYNLKV